MIKHTPPDYQFMREDGRNQLERALRALQAICDLGPIQITEHNKKSPHTVYLADGNTQTPGTEYNTLFCVPLYRPLSGVPLGVSDARWEYDDWAKGRAQSAIYYHLECTYRDSDRWPFYPSSSFFVCDIPLDQNSNNGHHRLGYSTNGIMAINKSHLKQAVIYINSIKASLAIDKQITDYTNKSGDWE